MHLGPVSAAVAAALFVAAVASAAAPDPDLVRRLAHSATTIEMDAARPFLLPEQRVRDDTGINVLVDLAHQCSFQMMWRVPPALRQLGFRAVGSQAALDSVLTPGGPCRVRIPVGGRWPFAWVPAPGLNVVLTAQGGPQSQDYLPEERAALAKFVKAGGGLIVVAGRVGNEAAAKAWTLNTLVEQFGATLSAKTDALKGRPRTSTLAVDAKWETVLAGMHGLPVCARRVFGKGRVIVSMTGDLLPGRARNPERDTRLAELVRWAAAGRKPVGGTLRLPRERSGGGPIYPELEERFGDIVVFYARNQTDVLLKTVREDLPAVRKQIFAWLPSKASGDPMYIVLSAGGGGGWAVNAYLPKETGIISLSRAGVISVFAHEQAHVMAGPRNAKGEVAGNTPQGNQGEAHAGWFQGKIDCRFSGRKSVKDCNRLFTFDKKGDALDLARWGEAAYRQKWGKGKDWTKLWWIWQTLDDRYGATWYPRWRWVQHTRWQDEPGRRLSWDDVVEDMSIAVGEDLFPFFRRIGTTLGKERFPKATFQGKPVELPVAPLEIGPAGDARLEAIGDYTQPLPRPRRE